MDVYILASRFQERNQVSLECLIAEARNDRGAVINEIVELTKRFARFELESRCRSFYATTKGPQKTNSLRYEYRSFFQRTNLFMLQCIKQNLFSLSVN